MCVFAALRVISNQIIFSRRRERLCSPMHSMGCTTSRRRRAATAAAAAAKRGAKSFSTVSPADYETRTDNEALISPTVFYLCLCTLLCCVSDKISVDRSIMRNGKEAKSKRANLFGLEGIKTNIGRENNFR